MANREGACLRAGALAGALAAMAAGCAPPDASQASGVSNLQVVGLADSGGRASLARDDLLAVELPARPSAGFTWEVASLDASVLTLAGREHLSAPSLGGKDLERLLFKGVSAGRASLSLVYRRPWEEPAPGDSTYALEVEVQGPYTGTYAAPAPRATSARSALLTASTAPARFNLCDPGDGSYSRCTPIKNQGDCGGCWAFATAGVFENLLFFANPSVKPSLSEQYLISCNTRGWNCAEGGNVAFDHYVNRYRSPPETAAGAVYTADFPFQEADVACGSRAHPHHEKLIGFSSLGRGVASVDAIKQALMTYGPVWTAVCADSAFSNYRYTGASSVFRGSCSDLNHAVILVGWDDNNGNGYWLLRNSWGNRWGDKGYMRIAFGANDVGSDSYVASYNVTPPTQNVAPVANAGRAQTVKSGATVTLDGSASSDPDGTIAKYAWAQTGGSSAVALSSASAVKPTFKAPSVSVDTSFAFTLTVTDDDGATATSSVVVTVTKENVPPTADAGRAQTVREGERVSLDGTGSADPDGAVASYAWSQVLGSDLVPAVSLEGAATAKPAFVAPSVPQGSVLVALTFALTVTDDAGATARATVMVTVVRANNPPVAEAGAAQTVSEGAAVALDGSASSDSDGAIASYSWAQTGGPAVDLAGSASARPSFTAPSGGDAQLTFELAVTDDAGATARDSVTIAVVHANRPPVADEGAPPDGLGGAIPGLSPFAAGCSSPGAPGFELGAVPFALFLALRRGRPLRALRRRR